MALVEGASGPGKWKDWTPAICVCNDFSCACWVELDLSVIDLPFGGGGVAPTPLVHPSFGPRLLFLRMNLTLYKGNHQKPSKKEIYLKPEYLFFPYNTRICSASAMKMTNHSALVLQVLSNGLTGTRHPIHHRGDGIWLGLVLKPFVSSSTHV